jgi:hypothetical protein
MPETVSASRRSRWILAPLIVVLALAVAWSAVWFYAARAADGMMAAWIEREAKVGRVYTCGARGIGGYPFRIEARCTDPTVELRGGTAPVVIKAREILAVAQIYQPDLVIAEVTGPMTITEPGGAAPLAADWSLMQASVRGLPSAVERVSLVVQGPKLDRTTTAAANAEPVMRAERLEFHVRRSTGSDAGKPAFDLAARASAAVVPSLPALAAHPLNAEAAAVLRGPVDLTPMPIALRLREWQAAGGRLEISNVRVQQGDAVAVAKGDLGLSARGRLDGALTLTVAGFDDLTRMLGLPTVAQGGRQAGILAGLAILGGQAELEGKRAMNIPLRFADGAVFFGPIPLGQTGPLY